MKYYMYTQEKVVGPYLPEEILEVFGGVSPDTLVCTDAECARGQTQWRKIGLFPELTGCIKREISEPLVKYAPDSPVKPALSILSTDDDSNIRALLWHMLTGAGHTVEFAKDGEEVFTRLSAKKYDLVILDVNMPKMNGYKVSELIHTKLHNPPKIIIFTGRDLEKERLQFAYSGADAILSKGTGNDTLLQTIENLFSKTPKRPAKKEKEAEVFIPEPTPPAINTPHVKTEPQHPPDIEPGKSAPPAGKADARVLPAPQEPILSREKNDELNAAFNQLILETSILKSDLADLKRSLGNLELKHVQLTAQFEKQALAILDKNQEIAKKMEESGQKTRNFMILTSLLLLIIIAATALSRY
jgi:DNA-binding response OmpR family regulator